MGFFLASNKRTSRKYKPLSTKRTHLSCPYTPLPPVFHFSVSRTNSMPALSSGICGTHIANLNTVRKQLHLFHANQTSDGVRDLQSLSSYTPRFAISAVHVTLAFIQYPRSSRPLHSPSLCIITTSTSHETPSSTVPYIPSPSMVTSATFHVHSLLAPPPIGGGGAPLLD